MRVSRFVVLVLIELFAVSCSGGGGNGSPAAPSAPTVADDSQQSGSATGIAAIPALPLASQTYTLSGKVTHSTTGRAVEGVRVQVLGGKNAGRSSKTSNSGNYRITNLKSSSFTIRATKSGYQQTDRTISLSRNTGVNLTLRPIATRPSSATCGNRTVPSSIGCGQPTAGCKDGTWSCSRNRSGTCSSHGGVACFICPGPLCHSLDETVNEAPDDRFLELLLAPPAPIDEAADDLPADIRP